MKRFFVLFVLCMVSSVVFMSCKDNSVSHQNDEGTMVSGTVVSMQGTALSGVGVHYIFTITRNTLKKVDDTKPSTVIFYQIPMAGHVTIKLLRWYTRDSVCTPLDTRLESGSYGLSIDELNLTSGLYIVQIITTQKTTESTIYFQQRDLDLLVKAAPIALTNANGAFSIPKGLFGSGHAIVETNPDGSIKDTITISNQIQLVLNKPGYATVTASIDLNNLPQTSPQYTLPVIAK
jgi:hypothetical protein